MEVAIYSRKSVETDTGESIKNQIKLCKEYFERHGECKFEIFEDEGFSGSNTNRPSFQRMMELVKIKQFDIVAVYKIDRIARNIVDFVNIYDQLESLGVQLVSITEGFDPSTPAGKMMMLLLASFAEMERMNIAQRVKDNMRELAKMGRWSGGTPPTGYRAVKSKEGSKNVTYLKLKEEESSYIKDVFTKYSEGYSTCEISKQLKSRGLHYPQKTIQNILANPTYLIATNESVKYLENQGYKVYGIPNDCGFLPYNRRPRTKNVKSWNDKTKLVGISKHQPIIDLDLWARVQEKLIEKKVNPHPRESEFTWLSNLIKCKCGSNMLVQPGRMKNDNTRVYYFRCRNKSDGLQCDNKYLRVDDAEEAVKNFFKLYLDKEYLRKEMNKGKDKKNLTKEMNAITKKIQTNSKYISNLNDKLMILSNAAAGATIDKIEELTKINSVLKDELLKLERAKLFDKQDEQMIDIFHNQVINFFNSDNEGKKYQIKLLVKYITWDSSTSNLQIEPSYKK